MIARPRATNPAGLILELVLLVVGINIALWFEGQFEDIRGAQSGTQYLQGLHRDLLKDIEELDSVLATNSAKVERLKTIVPDIPRLGDKPPQEATEIKFEASEYHFFAPEDFTYRSMRDSGDFRLLSDARIKEDLLRLNRLYGTIETLEANFIQALDDEYIPLMMQSFDLLELRLVDQSIVDNRVFRNFFAYTLQDTTTRNYYYAAAAESTRELVEVIAQALET